MGKWAAYGFGLASLFWSICLTALYIQTAHRLETFQHPGKSQYVLLRDLDLYFGLTETYDDMEKFTRATLKAGVWDYPRVFQYCMKMKTFIDEMKRRQVGEVTLGEIERNRLLVESDDYNARHSYYGNYDGH